METNVFPSNNMMSNSLVRDNNIVMTNNIMFNNDIGFNTNNLLSNNGMLTNNSGLYTNVMNGDGDENVADDDVNDRMIKNTGDSVSNSIVTNSNIMNRNNQPSIDDEWLGNTNNKSGA